MADPQQIPASTETPDEREDKENQIDSDRQQESGQPSPFGPKTDADDAVLTTPLRLWLQELRKDGLF